MTKRSTLFSAAVLSIGSIAYVGCDRNDTTTSNTGTSADRPTAGERVDNAMENAGDAAGRAVDKTVDATKDAGDKLADATDRAGDKLRDTTNNAADDARTASGRVGEGTAAAPDAEGIRDILASVTEAALTKGGLDDMVERLNDADRNRIGDAIGQDSPEHDALVEQFRADWKAKYNQEFDIQNEEKVFPEGMFSVAQGEIGAAAPSGAEVATGQRAGDVDANKERGRNVANVQVKASHGMPGLTVPLIHELPDAWRIDAPDTLTAAKLRSNVLAHLKAAHDMKAQWPANVDDAYAAVSHHVLMAILDQPVTK